MINMNFTCNKMSNKKLNSLPKFSLLNGVQISESVKTNKGRSERRRG